MLKTYLNGELKGIQLQEFELIVRNRGASAFITPDIKLPDTPFEKNILETVTSIESKLLKEDFFFIGQLKRRERPAQERLYRNLYPKVKKHILKNNGEEEDAKDFTQEVIIKLYKKLRTSGSEIKTVEGFVFGILKNDWLKELDKRKRTAERKEQFKTEQSRYNPNGMDVEEESENNCQKVILKESLTKLRNEQRDFLEYYDLTDHSIKETALHFKMSESSVKVKANRCRNYLRKKIVKHPNFEDCFNKKLEDE